METNLLKLRKQKLAQDLQSMERMRQLGIHPFDALDQLIHATIELMTLGYKKEHISATAEQVIDFMRRQADIYTKKRNPFS